MAVYDPWEMAVALPIKNYKFREGTTISSTLSSSVSLGASSITVSQTSPSLALIVKKGDIVSIGPSTNDSYDGKSENAVITNVDASVHSGNPLSSGYLSTPVLSVILTLNAPLSYVYSSGDSVKIYGTRLAGGWTVYSSDSRELIQPQTIKPYTGGYSGGKVDNYAQYLKFRFDTAEGIDASNRKHGNFKYEFTNGNPFIPHANYRFGAIVKAQAMNYSNGLSLGLKVYDGNQFLYDKWFPLSSYENTIQDWTELNSAGTNISTGTSLTNISSVSGLDTPKNNPYLLIWIGAANLTDKADLYVDTVYCEHAFGTTPVTQLTEKITAPGKTSGISVIDSSNFSRSSRVYVIGNNGNHFARSGLVKGIRDGTIDLHGTLHYYWWDDNLNQYVSHEEPMEDFDEGCTVFEANAGYYRFTEYPLMSSINYGIINQEQINVLANNEAKLSYPFSDSDKSDRYTVSCRFENVSEMFWNKLMALMYWQKKGYALNLHPKYNDLPPVMTGYMQINNLTKANHWDLTYRSFDFSFTELY